MSKLKKIWLLFLVICCMTGMTAAFAYAYSNAILDASKKIVYQEITAGEILEAFVQDENAAKEAYNGKYYMILGTLSEKSEQNLQLTDLEQRTAKNIICDTKNIKTQMEKLNAGSAVHVYGKLTIDTWNHKIYVSTAKTEATSQRIISKDTYHMLGLGSVSADTRREKSSMEQQTIGGGSFTYYIPKEWKNVETELPNMPGDGYQYKLNSLSGKGQAESLFVFYVDSKYLDDPADITQTTKVQKAIIRNILKGKQVILSKYFPLLDRDIDFVTVAAGYAEMKNYSGTFAGKNGRYRVEFIYLPDTSKQGLKVLLYVYDNNTEHADDVLYMMRMMY